MSIYLPLIAGGGFFGTPQECITFLNNHQLLVEESEALASNFRFSKSKGMWMYIRQMHPAYVRNVLLSLLEDYSHSPGYGYIEYLLDSDTIPHYLVGAAVRLWLDTHCSGCNTPMGALIEVLEATFGSYSDAVKGENMKECDSTYYDGDMS
jgi:hypothetical protein